MEILKSIFNFIILFLHTFDVLILLALYLYFSISEIGRVKKIVFKMSDKIAFQNHLINILMTGSCNGFSPLHRLIFYKTIEKNEFLTKEEISQISEEFNLKSTDFMLKNLEQIKKEREEEGDHERVENLKQKIKAIKEIGTLTQLVDANSSDEFKKAIVKEIQNIIEKMNYEQ